MALGKYAAVTLQRIVIEVLELRSKVYIPSLIQSEHYATKTQPHQRKQKPNRRARLKIILTEDVKNLGKAGDFALVKHGYGRNDLIPNKKAVYATHYNIEEYGITEENMKAAGQPKPAQLHDTEYIANYLKDNTLIVCQDPEPKTKNWVIFKQDISRAFWYSLQIHVPMDCIEMENPIREMGPSSVKVHLDEDTVVPVNLEVVPFVDAPTQRKREKKKAKKSEAL